MSVQTQVNCSLAVEALLRVSPTKLTDSVGILGRGDQALEDHPDALRRRGEMGAPMLAVQPRRGERRLLLARLDG